MDDINCTDHWTAVRCLACYGECNSQIVDTILSQLRTSSDETRRRQATNHLIELSKYTVNVIVKSQHSFSMTRVLSVDTTVAANLFGYRLRLLVV